MRVPRARIEGDTSKVTEWRSKALPRYQRLTKKAEALIAAVYLAGTNTRRVKRALFGLFEGAVSKDVVSRAWRKVKVDWDAWSSRNLADEDIVRLILDGIVINTRLPALTPPDLIRPGFGRKWFSSSALMGALPVENARNRPISANGTGRNNAKTRLCAASRHAESKTMAPRAAPLTSVQARIIQGSGAGWYRLL